MSMQRDASVTYYDHMMPKGSHTRIRSANIYYMDNISGFSFFDKEGALLCKFGNSTASYLKVETVLIEENEVIVGVVCKLYPNWQSVYTDFQF